VTHRGKKGGKKSAGPAKLDEIMVERGPAHAMQVLWKKGRKESLEHTMAISFRGCDQEKRKSCRTTEKRGEKNIGSRPRMRRKRDTTLPGVPCIARGKKDISQQL